MKSREGARKGRIGRAWLGTTRSRGTIAKLCGAAVSLARRRGDLEREWCYMVKLWCYMVKLRLHVFGSWVFVH